MYSIISRILAASALPLLGVRADCYWSDGTENDSHQPCYASQGGAAGLCCASGDICMTSGICMAASQSSGQGLSNGHSSTYYRGSCMYKDWTQGKDCPTVCLKGPGTSPHESVSMIPCPASDTDWYCGDGNMKKANCTSGEYIVSLAKANIFATIGVSPSVAAPKSTAPASALGGGNQGITKTESVAASSAPASGSSPPSSPTSPSATSAPHSTSPAASAGPSDSPSIPPAASTTFDTSASGSASGSAVLPPAPEQSTAPDSNNASAVPLAVGLSLGGACLVGAGVLGYFLWRRRRDSQAFARAETPPPRDTPDIDFMDPMVTGPLFRAGSLTRRPGNDYLNASTASRCGPGASENMATTERAHSMRTNSMRSSHQPHTPHHTRSVSQDRFGPDIVAMHNMRRTPPACWGYPRPTRGEPAETIPEIPYDGRRLPAYQEPPVLQNHGFYNELPG